MSVMTAVASAKFSKDMYGYDCQYMRPEAYFAVTYDLVSDRDNAVVSLTNGSGYVVRGKRLNRLGVEVGAGITAEITKHFDINVKYVGAFKNDYQNHTGYIGIRYKF